MLCRNQLRGRIVVRSRVPEFGAPIASEWFPVSALRRHKSSAAARTRRDGYTAFDQAFELFRGDALDRAELESRILAGQSTAEIAQACGQPEPVVVTYSEVFFEVTSRINSKGWIQYFAIAERGPLGLNGWSVPELWKFQGFWGGPIVVDALIAPVAKDDLRRFGTEAYFRRSANVPLVVKLLVASTCMQVDKPKSIRRALSLCDRVCAMTGRQTEQSGAKSTTMVSTALAAIDVSASIPELKLECAPKIPERSADDSQHGLQHVG